MRLLPLVRDVPKPHTRLDRDDPELPLRSGHLTQHTHTVVSKNSQRDTKFIKQAMSDSEGSPILLLAGHGYPGEVVGGPTHEHLRGKDFSGAVALNIACYTGVTGRWYEDDWRAMQVKQREVPDGESFCLNMLNTGVAGSPPGRLLVSPATRALAYMSWAFGIAP